MRLLLLTLLCIASWPTYSNDEASFGTVPYKDFHVGNISIGHSYRNVLKQLGKPLKEERNKANEDIAEYIGLYYSGLHISVYDGVVDEISVTSAAYKVKDIRLGATEASVLKSFGEAKPITLNNRTSLRYRSRAPNGQPTDAELRFFIEKRVVSEISLWFPSL